MYENQKLCSGHILKFWFQSRAGAVSVGAVISSLMLQPYFFHSRVKPVFIVTPHAACCSCLCILTQADSQRSVVVRQTFLFVTVSAWRC